MPKTKPEKTEKSAETTKPKYTPEEAEALVLEILKPLDKDQIEEILTRLE